MRASDASGRRDEERATKGFKVSAEDDSSTVDVGRNKRKRSRSHHRRSRSHRRSRTKIDDATREAFCSRRPRFSFSTNDFGARGIAGGRDGGRRVARRVRGGGVPAPRVAVLAAAPARAPVLRGASRIVADRARRSSGPRYLPRRVPSSNPLTSPPPGLPPRSSPTPSSPPPSLQPPRPRAGSRLEPQRRGHHRRRDRVSPRHRRRAHVRARRGGVRGGARSPLHRPLRHAPRVGAGVRARATPRPAPARTHTRRGRARRAEPAVSRPRGPRRRRDERRPRRHSCRVDVDGDHAPGRRESSARRARALVAHPSERREKSGDAA